jgi:hypothetical protein
MTPLDEDAVTRHPIQLKTLPVGLRAPCSNLRPATPPSFRTQQVDFLLPFRSGEKVGLRREKSLFALSFQ